MTQLSVVLISRNQAWSIRRLIESVLVGTSCVSSKEIILVDSASTDETVELAKRYPVTIFRLKFGQRLSPAIGRYVGYRQTQGEFVLFLDGDMELLQGWLEPALNFMRTTPRVGLVMSTSVTNLHRTAAQQSAASLEDMSFTPPRESSRVPFAAGGAALYRHSVLEQVGSFNPYLYSEEEPELCLRIRGAGYSVSLFNQPIVLHYDDAPVALSDVLSRRRRNFHLGMGQGARYHFPRTLFWRWIKERWWGPAAALLVAAGLGSAFLGVLMRDFMWFGLWILGLCFLTAFLAVRKHSLRAALVAAFNWFVMAEGFLRGFLLKPLPPENFHPDFEVIRDLNGGEKIWDSRLGRKSEASLLCLTD
jgi:glycosyltransferase involved in cell wall biosynthesis